MPEISPFKAYRYNQKNKGLARDVCPPYDVIGDRLARELRKIRENAIHVELPLGLDHQKYKNARDQWDKWKESETVLRDPVKSFYIYEQAFKAEGKRHVRRGFFCELTVEEPGKGAVLRHELTLSGPKADRLNLLRTTRINTSPIFGLFADAKSAVRKIMHKNCRVEPLTEIRDREQVVHKVWRVADPDEVHQIERALSDTPVLIADGHHRYETSWNYFQELRIREGAAGPSSRMLFFLCPMEDPGLVIFPTHRVSKNLTFDQLLKRALSKQDIFRVKPVKKPSVPKPGFFTITDGKKAFSVKLKSPAPAKKILGEKPKAYLALVLVHIHSLLLPGTKKEDFTYTHDLKEALALARSQKRAAILVPPVSVKELNSIVTAGELMPQKSTYFYPKIITGLIFRSLD